MFRECPASSFAAQTPVHFSSTIQENDLSTRRIRFSPGSTALSALSGGFREWSEPRRERQFCIALYDLRVRFATRSKSFLRQQNVPKLLQQPVDVRFVRLSDLVSPVVGVGVDHGIYIYICILLLSYINTIYMPETITYKQYLKNTIIGTSTTVIDKTATGFFEMPVIRSSQDMALWCRFLRQGMTGFGLDKTLTIYRVVCNSHTADKFRAASDVWRVYRKFEKKGLFDSVYYFIYYIFNAVMKRIKFRAK